MPTRADPTSALPSTPQASGGSNEEGEAQVRLRNVRKVFGDVVVLDGLDLSVRTGEKVAIIGPSGSGKTTILRLLMTLEKPTEGTVDVGGDRLWDETGNRRTNRRTQQRAQRKVGMVFQHFNLFPHMTALRNVTEAPVFVLAMSAAEAEAHAVRLLDLVGLADKLDHKPAQLSGGQQQRVAIARALAMQPQVMLFDEVTSALDPELVGEVLNVMRELAHSTSMTMLIVTHQMRFAQEIANRVLMLDGGRIVEEGPPDRIFKSPQHERTRRFLDAVLDA